MHELRQGLWHWQAPHPAWEPDSVWPQHVSSYAIDDGDRLLLVDPLAVPAELLALARDRETVVVLTSPWHERDSEKLVRELGVPIYAPPPDTAQDLMAKFGITPEQAGAGSPDLVWLPGEDVTREEVAEGLRPLLELPIEHVLPTHGTPTDRAALERALA